ncbi:MAG: hypothetical protein K6E16_12730 [Lachnospiraceae bacterium]|nr:hypothetical protein [Lachnospiraceae bacterium]
MKKPKHPAFALLWLLGIPVQIVIDILLFTLGAMADTAIANPGADQLGHPAPAFTIIALIIVVIFTIIIPLASIIVTIVRFAVLNKKYQAYQASRQTA